MTLTPADAIGLLVFWIIVVMVIAYFFRNPPGAV